MRCSVNNINCCPNCEGSQCLSPQLSPVLSWRQKYALLVPGDKLAGYRAICHVPCDHVLYAELNGNLNCAV